MKKVLIANRGEIAVRIARALKDVGLGSVAIYSDADALAYHVRVADEAYPVGPAPALQSYLDSERILSVAQKCGADAVHPGYGFLAENADFAEACAARGLTFIGPPASAIRSMGQKIRAREVMAEAGVPVVPGGSAHTLEEAKASATSVGYPVMLKPASGGGGKGMRRVASEAELVREWDSARQEAARSFSDATMYLEKYLVAPRHIEVQVLGDQQGQVVHLFERDCSLQRRHQKVLEEAPAAALLPELALEMGRVSVAGARALGYFSAGTFEYLLDAQGHFFFLEMNTRLQVEHGVTELVTGIDLVEQMLSIARGEPLAFLQEEVVRRGHAIECRIYAEDPEQGFLPSPGKIERLELPEGPGVRNDEGAKTGDTITSFYDPLIAKLLTWGSTRQQCIARMRRALGEYVVTGPRTNLEFLRQVLQHGAFSDTPVDTGFIQDHQASLSARPEPLAQDDLRRAAAAAALLHYQLTPGSAAAGPAERGLSEWVRQHRRSNWTR